MVQILKRKRIGFILGPVLFCILIFSQSPENLDPSGWYTAAIAVLMAVFWITETIPIAVTALMPLLLFPLFGITDITKAAFPYANPLIFLFLGGFIIALGMQRWNLHKRIALEIIHLIGVQPSRIIAGFMIASAITSMWVSNTATTMMMLPIGISVISLSRDQNKNIPSEYKNFSLCLMLGIAYGASVGGLATLIGTPPMHCGPDSCWKIINIKSGLLNG